VSKTAFLFYDALNQAQKGHRDIHSPYLISPEEATLLKPGRQTRIIKLFIETLKSHNGLHS